MSVNMASAPVEVSKRAREDGTYLLRQEINITRPNTGVGRNTYMLFDSTCPVNLITHELAKDLDLEYELIPTHFTDPRGRHGTSNKRYTIASGMGDKKTMLVHVWEVEKLLRCPAQDPPVRM